MRMLRVAIPLFVLIGLIGAWVYSAALTPEEAVRLTAEQIAVDWSTVRDDPDERLEISFMGPGFWPGGEEGGWIERMLEERFNVELTPVSIAYSAVGSKKAMLLAGGAVPDIIWEANPVDLQADARHGFLVPLPYEVILKHAPTYMALLNRHAPIAWLYSYNEGRNYGLPTKYMAGLPPVPGVWRMDWLEKVGIHKIPDTLEEMRDALWRFRHSDPDGNGLKDTYGMTHDVSHHWWTGFSEIFGAYGVTPHDWQVVDGQAIFGGVRPEAKEAVALLRQWYADGLIDPEFVTDLKSGSVSKKLLNGRVGYMYYGCNYLHFDPTSPSSFVNVLSKLHPNARLVPGLLPKGPGGQRGARVWGAGGNIISFTSSAAKNPAKILRYLRMMEQVCIDEDFYIASHYGKQGLHWKYRDPSIGPNSGIEYIAPYDDKNIRDRNLICGFYICDVGDPAIVEKYEPRDALAFRKAHQPVAYALTDALGKPDVVPSAAEHLMGLRAEQTLVYSKIIRGDMPLKAFDEFVTYWYDHGGREMTREADELLEAKHRIYRQVGITQ